MKSKIVWVVTIHIGYEKASAEFATSDEAVLFTDIFLNSFGKDEAVSLVINPRTVDDGIGENGAEEDA